MFASIFAFTTLHVDAVGAPRQLICSISEPPHRHVCIGIMNSMWNHLICHGVQGNCRWCQLIGALAFDEPRPLLPNEINQPAVAATAPPQMLAATAAVHQLHGAAAPVALGGGVSAAVNNGPSAATPPPQLPAATAAAHQLHRATAPVALGGGASAAVNCGPAAATAPPQLLAATAAAHQLNGAIAPAALGSWHAAAAATPQLHAAPAAVGSGPSSAMDIGHAATASAPTLPLAEASGAVESGPAPAAAAAAPQGTLYRHPKAPIGWQWVHVPEFRNRSRDQDFRTAAFAQRRRGHIGDRAMARLYEEQLDECRRLLSTARGIDFRFWAGSIMFDTVWQTLVCVAKQPTVAEAYVGITECCRWRWADCWRNESTTPHRDRFDIMFPICASYGSTISALERLLQAKLFDCCPDKCSHDRSYRRGPVKDWRSMILYVCVKRR